METLAIESLAVQVRGVSYKPEDLHSSLDDSSVILLRANNIDDGIINFDDVVFVDKKRVSNEQFLRKGDILVCASSGSKNLVGKAARVGFDKEVTFGAFCKVVRPRNIEDADYLAMFFQSPVYRREITAAAIGANINNIRNEHIDALPVKWPATVKRSEIVNVLYRAESIIRTRKQQLSALDDLIKARFVEMFGERGKQVPLKDYVWFQEGPGVRSVDFTSDGTILLTGSNINDNKITFGYKSDRFISNELANGKYSHFICDVDDILVVSSAIDPSKFDKKVTIVREDKKYCLNTGIIRFKPKKEYLTLGYFREFLKTDYFKHQVMEEMRGIAQMHFGPSHLKEMTILLPESLGDQVEFERFVSQIDKSKSVIQKSLDETQLLFDSLMQKYFG